MAHDIDSAHAIQRMDCDAPLIAFVTSGIGTSFGDEEWSGARDAAKRLGARLLCVAGRPFAAAESQPDPANEIYRLTTGAQPDAIILWPEMLDWYAGTGPVIDLAQRFKGIPLISCEHRLDGATMVAMDDYSGMFDAVRHLSYTHGRKRVAFLYGSPGQKAQTERFRAWREATYELGMDTNPRLAGPGTVLSNDALAERWMKETLMSVPDIDGVIIGSEAWTMAAIAALRKSGRVIPDDVSVIGFDDSPYFLAHDPPIATIRTPLRELGARAVELALDRIKSPKRARDETMRTTFVVRRSCGCLPPTLQNAGACDEPANSDLERTLRTEFSPVGSESAAIGRFIAAVAGVAGGESANESGKHMTQAAAALCTELGPVAREHVQDIVTILRRSATIHGPHAEEAFHQARVAIEEHIRTDYLSLAVHREFALRDIARLRDELSQAQNAEELATIACKNLAELDVAPVAMLLRGTDGAFRIAPPSESEYGIVYDPTHAWPGRLVPSKAGDCAMALPIVYDDANHGMVVFGGCSCSGWFYEGVVNEIASALHYLMRVVEIEKREALYERLATIDALTGILNRRRIIEILEHEIAEATRYSRKLSVAMIDVDHFKDINDRFGHLVGDAVLTRIASSIAVAIRASDYCGRYGGEEFLLVLPETTGAEALVLAERLRDAIAQAAVPDGTSVTISIGVADLAKTSATTAEDFIDIADIALYKAKQGGRNKVVLGLHECDH